MANKIVEMFSRAVDVFNSTPEPEPLRHLSYEEIFELSTLKDNIRSFLYALREYRVACKQSGVGSTSAKYKLVRLQYWHRLLCDAVGVEVDNVK